jgi:hypothetical protein
MTLFESLMRVISVFFLIIIHSSEATVAKKEEINNDAKDNKLDGIKNDP